jgi:hypothetical protein
MRDAATRPIGARTAPNASLDADNVELVSHLGGPTSDVFVQGNYLYINEGPKLTILDNTDPAAPTVIGQSLPMPDIVSGVTVSGNHAYIADGSGGLRVLDVSNPRVPVECGTFPFQDAQQVTVEEDFAYVADKTNGLWIFDISVPCHPAARSQRDPEWIVTDIAVSGAYAYIVGYKSGMAPPYEGRLEVLDLSDPIFPLPISSITMPVQISGITLSGTHAFVANADDGLVVLDISTPVSPTEVSRLDLSGSTRAVALSGGYAYLAVGPTAQSIMANGLYVIDVSDLTSPAYVRSYTTSGGMRDVTVSNGHAYVSNSAYGLHVIDISNPTDPHVVNAYETMISPRSMAIRGLYAYVADERMGLWMLDMTDPASPAKRQLHENPRFPYAMTVQDDFVYATGSSSLHVLQRLSPSLLYNWGSCSISGAGDIAVAGNYAYVTSGSNGLQVVSLAHPTIPETVASCDTPGSCSGVELSEPYAYVADGQEGMRVIDISTPPHPREIGLCDTPGSARDIAISGTYAYVADGHAGLNIVDITTPTNPICGWVLVTHRELPSPWR